MHRPAVIVVLALHRQHRHANVRQTITHMPAAHLGLEPHIGPGQEHAIDIAVIARQLAAQHAIGPGRAMAGNGLPSHGFIFGVRCHHDGATDIR